MIFFAAIYVTRSALFRKLVNYEDERVAREMELGGECNIEADELSAAGNGVAWKLVRSVTQYTWVVFGKVGFLG